MKIQKTLPCHPEVTMFTPTPDKMSRIKKKEDTRYIKKKTCFPNVGHDHEQL